MKEYLSIIIIVGLSNVSIANENLIKNGDFEKGSTRWNGDQKVVYEKPDKKNRVCKIDVDEDQDLYFCQEITKSHADKSLMMRFRLKSSADFSGTLDAKVGVKNLGAPGASSHIDVPANNEWNVVEYSFDWYGGSLQPPVYIGFVVKSGDSGTLWFDDIEVYEE